MHTPRIAFLGLGLMGAAMARRLLESGFSVTVYNRNPAKTALLVLAGARGAFSPAEAVRFADVVVAMVSDDDASRSIWLGAEGALTTAIRGAVCIECSSISVAHTSALALAAVGRGCPFLDAPVIGDQYEAACGGLKFVVGGDASSLEKVESVFAALGREVIHLGPIGSGALFKLADSSLTGVQVAAYAEVLALFESSGLDCSKAVAAITAGANCSPIVKGVAARMSAHDRKPGFPVALLAKDLRYATVESSARARPLTVAKAALALLAEASAGHADRDIASIAEHTRLDR